MKTSSLLSNIVFQENKPKVDLLMETAFTKEIRIVFQKNQFMREHTSPEPIVVEIYDGVIEFGVNGEKYLLKKGDILTLDAKIPHDLLALESSIVRLTLSKKDEKERVQNVINK